MISDIALTLNSSYVPGAAACLRSLVHRVPGETTIWVIHDSSLTAQDHSLLGKAAGGLRMEGVLGPKTNLPLWGAASEAVYFRLALHELLPVPHVLYLDTDCIVLHDLDELLKVDASHHPLAAVQDHFWRRGPHSDLSGYFNSGVMVCNLDWWRAVRLADRAYDFIRSTPCKFWDQDALNTLFEGEWLELEPFWNAFHFTEIGDVSWSDLSPQQALSWWGHLEDRARVLHYVTGLKPWLKGYPPGRNADRFETFSRCATP